MNDPTMNAESPLEPPMREDQREYIYRLLDTSTLIDEAKISIMSTVDYCSISEYNANDIIQFLKESQPDNEN